MIVSEIDLSEIPDLFRRDHCVWLDAVLRDGTCLSGDVTAVRLGRVEIDTSKGGADPINKVEIKICDLEPGASRAFDHG